MSTLWRSRVGEAKAMTWFVEMGYDVFAPIFGNAECDFLATKDNLVKRVQVKTTNNVKTSGKYEVQLRSIRPNNTQNTVHKFDAKKCDYLVVYFEGLDALGLYRAERFDGKSTARLLPGEEP